MFLLESELFFVIFFVVLAAGSCLEVEAEGLTGKEFTIFGIGVSLCCLDREMLRRRRVLHRFALGSALWNLLRFLLATFAGRVGRFLPCRW